MTRNTTKHKTIQQNRIRALREERGLSSLALAKMIGTSAPHMSRLENGETALSIDWLAKLEAALKVSAREIVDLPFESKFTASCDEALLSSVIGWLLEAADKFKVRLSRQDLAHWSSYIYSGAVDQGLNFKQTQYLAITIVRTLQAAKSK